MLQDCANWPGIRRAVAAVAHMNVRRESPLESRSYLFFYEQDLPLPEMRVTIYDDDGVFVARVDFLWRRQRTIGEADGRGKYTDRDVLYAEKQREDRLRELGYEVVRWDWDGVTRAPQRKGARIRAAFARAQARHRFTA